MFDKSFTDMLTALATAAAALAALGTLLYEVRQYWRDRRRQQAALTRVDLQAIVEDCSQFLRPLSQTYPYPILHTSTAITQQFCSYLGEPREWKDIKALFDDKRLLRSIVIEGWISSSQVRHLLDRAEDLEHKASSYNLQGKLLFICSASFLLAGIVAEICSPETFYDMLLKLYSDDEICTRLRDRISEVNTAQSALNIINVELQQHICESFNQFYKDAIKKGLYIIKTAAGLFISLGDDELLQLAKTPKGNTYFSPEPDSTKPIVERIEQVELLSSRREQVRNRLEGLKEDIGEGNCCDLLTLIDSKSIKRVIDSQNQRISKQRKKQAALSSHGS